MIDSEKRELASLFGKAMKAQFKASTGREREREDRGRPRKDAKSNN